MHNPPLKIMAPAVEGVQKAHGLFFILRRQGFYYRTEHDFQQPAAHGIDNDGNRHDRQPDALGMQVAEQPDHGILLFDITHAS